MWREMQMMKTQLMRLEGRKERLSDAIFETVHVTLWQRTSKCYMKPQRIQILDMCLGHVLLPLLDLVFS